MKGINDLKSDVIHIKKIASGSLSAADNDRQRHLSPAASTDGVTRSKITNPLRRIRCSQAWQAQVL